ncbi:MAG: serine protease [Rhodobacteraceae bacterium]|nr:MAG: serine protease [Paracoccaceae bacterium]
MQIYVGAEIIVRKCLVRCLNTFSLVSVMLLLFLVRADSRAAPESFADLVEELSPAVVNITSTTLVTSQQEFNPRIPPGSPFEEFFREFQDRDGPNNSPRRRRGSALGSGFIISADGFVVTNNHVIENADEIEIEMIDGTLLQAEVFGRDEKTDIALLKVVSETTLPFVQFGDASKARAGDWVLAIGNPLGQGFSVSAGIISARGRSLNGSYDDFIQTDAAINKGNSGGPLFNMSGEVIGVNTAILSPTGGSIGIGFSMSSSVVQKVVNQLQSFGETRRGWLGVRIQDISEDVAEALGLDSIEGALITDVPDGPAQKAGLKSGDIITTFDGTVIDNTRTLVRVVGDSEVGKAVEVILLRDGKRVVKTVILGRLEEALLSSNTNKRELKKSIIIAGMTVSTITEKIRSEMELAPDLMGLVVSNVVVGSDAEAKGIRAGDIITKIGKTVISLPLEFRDEIDKALKEDKKSLLLLIYRDGSRRFVALALEK